MASQCYGLHIGILMTVIGDVKYIAVFKKNKVFRASNILPLFAVVSTENNSPYRIFVELFLCVYALCLQITDYTCFYKIILFIQWF